MGGMVLAVLIGVFDDLTLRWRRMLRLILINVIAIGASRGILTIAMKTNVSDVWKRYLREPVDRHLTIVVQKSSERVKENPNLVDRHEGADRISGRG